jgi:protein-S-isoprenylcysteine O-methyltransferase Ste14
MGRHDDDSRREHLAGEHPFSDRGQLIFLGVFMVVWVADSFIFRFSIFAGQYVSLLIRIPIAAVFLFASGYLAQQGMRVVFGEERQEPIVINEGVFSVVRHPVYLGCILFYLGLLILTLSLVAAIIWIVIIVFYHVIAKYEEGLLAKKFGKEYEQYMQTVPMWIPRLKSKREPS